MIAYLKQNYMYNIHIMKGFHNLSYALW